MFAVSLIVGCGGDSETTEEAAPAAFVSAAPPGGEIAANGSITVTFDNAPADVTVSAGTVTVAGKTATITGPFTPGPLALTVTWADGTQALNYTVTAPDTDPPAVTGGTVKDGDKDVDPKPSTLPEALRLSSVKMSLVTSRCRPKAAMMSVGSAKSKATKRYLKLSKAKRLATRRPMLSQVKSQTLLATLLMSV